MVNDNMLTNIKKAIGLPHIVFVALIVFGIALFYALQVRDMRNIDVTFDENISFSKTRIIYYESYRANDKVKSLTRLLDKTTELSNHLVEWNAIDKTKLKNYLEEQHIDCVFLLDKDLHVTTQIAPDDNAEQVCKSLVEQSYINEIVQYPKKIYTTQVSSEGSLYDAVVLARKDSTGLLVTLKIKEEMGEAYGDLTLSTLFKSFHFEKNGLVVVSDNNVIVSSNDDKLQSETLVQWQQLITETAIKHDPALSIVNYDDQEWICKKDAIDSYKLYMLFPVSQIFLTRNIVCSIYALVSIIVFLIFILASSRSVKKSMLREQKRLRIIQAIGQAYYSLHLVHINSHQVENLKGVDIALIPPADGQASERILRKIKETVAPQFYEAYLEFMCMETLIQRLKGSKSLVFTFQKADGTWIRSVLVPQDYDEDGNLNAVLVANRDVTLEKQHEITQENALRKALATAENANKAKTFFLNNISHDIRTPMNAIIGFTALALSHIDNKEHVYQYLNKIGISSKHLLSLINDVLDMSRIENGKVKIEEKAVHLPDIMHDLRSIIHGNICAKQQDLFIDTQDVIHEDILTDKLRLNQILLNIVSNAVKFTPFGGTIKIQVSEKPCQTEGYATFEFRIKDNGIGIDEKFQAQIFDSFARERTVTESGIQGTGLGLAIVKHIVEMMNGTIALKSEKGQGSEFIVTLNCKLNSSAIHYEIQPRLRGARALVVDDDANTCMSVSKMLRKIQMQADWTTTGKEAVLRAKEAWESGEAFAVYIIDWMMPDMNGIETVRRIRGTIGNDVPIIILTAYDSTDIEEEARKAGVTAFVSKPLFMSELVDVLKDPGHAQVVTQHSKSSNHEGQKVLLVEDNALNREIAEALLEEAGLIVESVNDGSEAVERMQEVDEDKYDLILMDIQMPKMDGYSATRAIRKLENQKKANIPIIAMTANAFEEDKHKSFEAGLNGHIAKPIEIKKILKVLDECLG